MQNRHIWIGGRLLVYSVLIVYVLVSVAALACAGSVESVQHHAAAPFGHSSHSLLCALACQANIGASLSVAMVGLFVVGCWLAAYDSMPHFPASHPRQWRSVRGPPLSLHLF